MAKTEEYFNELWDLRNYEFPLKYTTVASK